MVLFGETLEYIGKISLSHNQSKLEWTWKKTINRNDPQVQVALFHFARAVVSGGGICGFYQVDSFLCIEKIFICCKLIQVPLNILHCFSID